jgi:beta-galactosidase
MAIELSLNGTWEAGIDHQYQPGAQVPGLAVDPSEITPGLLWHRHRVRLPEDRWSYGTLLLKGARFWPHVYIDGEMISQL